VEFVSDRLAEPPTDLSALIEAGRRRLLECGWHLAVRAGVLSHSGHADLSARVGPDAILVATVSRRHDLGPDDLAVIRLDGTVAEGDRRARRTSAVGEGVDSATTAA
jgi:hypothetical protein